MMTFIEGIHIKGDDGDEVSIVKYGVVIKEH